MDYAENTITQQLLGGRRLFAMTIHERRRRKLECLKPLSSFTLTTKIAINRVQHCHVLTLC